MLVQTPFAQSLCNLLRGFCNHNNSIANNPSELQKCRLHPLIHSFSPRDHSTAYWDGQKGRDCELRDVRWLADNQNEPGRGSHEMAFRMTSAGNGFP
jgi:hypothetical protein